MSTCIWFRVVMFVSFNSNMTSANSGAGTTNSFGSPEVRGVQSLVFRVVFHRSLFVILCLAILLSVFLLFMAYPFGILKPFFSTVNSSHIVLSFIIISTATLTVVGFPS